MAVHFEYLSIKYARLLNNHVLIYKFKRRLQIKWSKFLLTKTKSIFMSSLLSVGALGFTHVFIFDRMYVMLRFFSFYLNIFYCLNKKCVHHKIRPSI